VTAGERAEAIEVRLDVAKQGIGKMDAKQIGQGRIRAIEIHAGSVGRQQSRPITGICDAIILARLH
jgi:hypothetical protein